MSSTNDLTPREREALEEAKDAIRAGDVDPDAEDTITVAFETSEGWLDDEGKPIPEGADVLVGKRGPMVEREAAEKNGYEIIDEDPDADDRPYLDPVRVPWDYGDRSLPGADGEEGGD